MLASGSTTMSRIPAVVRPAANWRRPLSRAARRSYQGLIAPAITAAMKRAAANGWMMSVSRASAMMVRTSRVQRAACGLRMGRTWPVAEVAFSFGVDLVMDARAELSAPRAALARCYDAPMVGLTHEPIDVGALTPATAEDGAACLFLGVVRNENGGRPVRHLEYEAYEEMALPLMEEIAAAARPPRPGAQGPIVPRLPPPQVRQPPRPPA